MDAREPDLSTHALRERWEEFRRAGEQARDIAGPLGREQLWWRPPPTHGPGYLFRITRWSVGECLDHLCRAARAYFEVIDEAVEKGRAAGLTGGEPSGSSLYSRILVDGVEPPARLRIPAPSSIRPQRPDDPEADDPAPQDVVGAFVALRSEIVDRLEAADGLDLEKVRIRSPFVKLVSVNLDTAFRVMSGHERRHLRQAREVLEHSEFPLSPDHA